jgi:hypothetical protein
MSLLSDRFPIYKQVGWEAETQDKIPYLTLAVAFTIVVFVFEFYLDSRQLFNFRTVKVKELFVQ